MASDIQTNGWKPYIKPFEGNTCSYKEGNKTYVDTNLDGRADVVIKGKGKNIKYKELKDNPNSIMDSETPKKGWKPYIKPFEGNTCSYKEGNKTYVDTNIDGHPDVVIKGKGKNIKYKELTDNPNSETQKNGWKPYIKPFEGNTCSYKEGNKTYVDIDLDGRADVVIKGKGKNIKYKELNDSSKNVQETFNEAYQLRQSIFAKTLSGKGEISQDQKDLKKLERKLKKFSLSLNESVQRYMNISEHMDISEY